MKLPKSKGEKVTLEIFLKKMLTQYFEMKQHKTVPYDSNTCKMQINMTKTSRNLIKLVANI